jgi:tetratricopeptide (TPR) repeat protein
VVVQESREAEVDAEVQALVTSGKNALATGDLPGAILAFEQALDLDDKDELTRQLLAETKVQVAEVRQILRELEETIAGGRDQQIVQFWQEHAARLDTLPEAQVHRARVEEARARCEALDLFQDAVASGKIGQIANVLTAQGTLLDACQDLAAGDRKRAEGGAALYHALRRALEMENDLEVRRLEREIQREWPGGLEAKAQQEIGEAKRRLQSKAGALVSDGEAALARGDVESGIAFLEQALTLDGDNQQARQLLDDARATGIGEEPQVVPEAQEDLLDEEVGAKISVDPAQVRALVDRARSTFEQGDLFRAEAMLGEALGLDPGNEEIRQFRDWVRQQNPRLRYYDPSVKGWLPGSESDVRIDAPYKLIIVEGFREGVWYPIFANSRLTLGRSRRCHIVLNDNHVSRQHAILTCDGRRCQIEDRGSLNGTYLNGKRITGRSEIRAGDHLQFGDILMRLEAGSTLFSEKR